MNKITRLISAKSPEILVALGIGTFIGAIVLAAKSAPAVKEALEVAGESKELTPAQKVKIAAPYYAPAVGAALLGMGLVVTSNRVQGRRYTSLFAMYSFTESALSRWQQSTIESVAKKKFQEIERKVNAPTDPDIPENLLLDEQGVIVWDQHTAKYFKIGSVHEIHAAVNVTNETALKDDFASLNDFYHELGIPPVPYGGEWGWGSGGHLLEVRLEPYIRDDAVIPVSLVFVTPPKHYNDIDY